MIKFQCEHCGQRMTAADEDVATTTQCPDCHRMLLVPAATNPAPPPTPSPSSSPPPAQQHRTKPSPAEAASDALAGHFRGTVAAFALIATIGSAVFSLWAEWGPYAWIVAVQMAIAHAYSPKATMAITFLVFLFPSVIFYFKMIKGRLAKLVFASIMGTTGVLLFAATGYFMATGDPMVHSTFIGEAIASANFLPHQLTVTASSLSDLPTASAYRIKKSGNSTVSVYTPIPLPKDSPGPSLLYLATEKGSLEYHLQYDKDLTGTLRYRPLPYLVRRAAPPGTPLFALVFTKDESVRSVWLPALFTLGAVGLILMESRRKRPKRNGPPPTRRLP